MNEPADSENESDSDLALLSRHVQVGRAAILGIHKDEGRKEGRKVYSGTLHRCSEYILGPGHTVSS